MVNGKSTSLTFDEICLQKINSTLHVLPFDWMDGDVTWLVHAPACNAAHVTSAGCGGVHALVRDVSPVQSSGQPVHCQACKGQSIFCAKFKTC